MASNGATTQSDGQLNDTQAAAPSMDEVGVRRDAASRASAGQILPDGEPAHTQAAESQSTHAGSAIDLCGKCGLTKEDWQRYVLFAVEDQDGAERGKLTTALFDTGTKSNLLSLNHVRNIGITFGDYKEAERPRSRWKRLISKICRKSSQARCYTVDMRPIKIVGEVKGQRWRGLESKRCKQVVSFTPQFLMADFLIVENLAYDAIFGSETMHELRGGSCSELAAFFGQKPKPTKDPQVIKRSKDEKKEQERIQREQERKRDEQRKNPPKK